MQSTWLKIFPYHIFLIPVFFIWHLLNTYFALIPFSYWSRFLFYYISLAVALFLMGKLLFKNTIKAGCWATSLLIIFFFWGAAHDFLRSLHLPAFLISYKFLLPLTFILIVVIFFILRKRNPLKKISIFFTILFGSFILIEAFTSITKSINKEYLKNNLSFYDKPLYVNPVKIDNDLKPDIFFIIFDEYASTIALKKYLSYDNGELDSILLHNNFFVVKNSKSNYDLTPLCLASTFNLRYFNIPLEGKESTSLDLLKDQYSLKKSLLPQLLAKEGYTIVNHGICDLENYPSPAEPYFNRFIRGILYNETIAGRIEKEIGWNFIAIQKKLSLEKTNSKAWNEIKINDDNFHALLNELNTQTNTPKFVFGHIMLPHTPYYLNRFGKKRARTDFDATTFNDSLYIDQLIYTNTLIDTLAKGRKQGVQTAPGSNNSRGSWQPECDDSSNYPGQTVYELK
jgi:hypothetical protein